MTDGMEVDPEALRKRSPRFTDAADRLRKAFEDLKTVQDAEDGCWGDDDAGKEFDGPYREAEGHAKAGHDEIVKGLEGTTTGLNASADRWESDDRFAAEEIAKAGGAT